MSDSPDRTIAKLAASVIYQALCDYAGRDVRVSRDASEWFRSARTSAMGFLWCCRVLGYTTATAVEMRTRILRQPPAWRRLARGEPVRRIRRMVSVVTPGRKRKPSIP